jgi:CheY-like chemotaxis protein
MLDQGNHSPSTSASQVASLACTDLAGVRVLVVDDDSDARRLTKRLLTHCKAEVATAASAAEALEMVPAFQPNVLVSDISMPGVDGYQLIHKIRGEYSAEAMPAVAVTAFTRPEDRRKALAAGYQSHLPKPVSPEELLSVVASLAARAGSISYPPVAHDCDL